MTAIKKAYVEIIELLEANANKKVRTVLPAILELCKSKGSAVANTMVRDEVGNVLALYCYYHKKWELVSECEYGAKKSTSSGLNTMCKEGVSNWTKQQRIAKQAKSVLLDDAANGVIAVEDILSEQVAIEEARSVVVPRLDGQGTDEQPAV